MNNVRDAEREERLRNQQDLSQKYMFVLKMIKSIGWVLWKLNLAYKIIDDIEDIELVTDKIKGISIAYNPTKWHYKLK